MNAITPAPSFPPNPTVGQVFLNWVWSGSSWVCRGAGPVNIIKVFTASATYWPSPGLTFAIVECFGAGGGGGEVALGSGTLVGGAGGGGSGGYSRSSIAAALVLNGVQVTVPGPSTSQQDGGDTSFGSYCIAHGGLGGTGNAASGGVWGQGGWGADPGVGDIAIGGNAGRQGDNYKLGSGSDTVFVVYGGQGGSILGGSAPAVPITPGVAPPPMITPGGMGAGGSGAVADNAVGTGNAIGANGGPGMCIVTEWCFGNTSLVQDCGCGPSVPADPCQPCPPPGGSWWTPNW